MDMSMITVSSKAINFTLYLFILYASESYSLIMNIRYYTRNSFDILNAY